MTTPLSGHVGIFKTYKRLYEVAYWPGMWTDLKTFIQHCAVCQKPAGTDRCQNSK